MDLIELLTVVALVLLGTLAHVLKRIVEVRQDNKEFGIKEYFGLYPYATALMVLTALGTSAGLYAAGELTLVTAFATGYMAQSVARATGNK